jgi:hypothetical protein
VIPCLTLLPGKITKVSKHRNIFRTTSKKT